MTAHDHTLILIYDGDCLLCRNTALAIRLKQAVKQFELIDARSPHPLVECIKLSHVNLNQGIVIIYQGTCYEAQDAVQLLATLTTPANLFNRMVASLFKHRKTIKILYPLLKCLRRLLLWVRGISLIPQNQARYFNDTIAQAIGHELPPVLAKRYHIDTHAPNCVHLEGTLTITRSPVFNSLAWAIHKLGFTISQQGEDIPTHVELCTEPGTREITMKRTMQSKEDTKTLTTKILYLHDDYFIEMSSPFLALRYKHELNNRTLTLRYAGFCIRLGKHFIHVPGMGLVTGKPFVHETAIDQDTFSMEVRMVHLFGYQLLLYHGVFKVLEHTDTNKTATRSKKISSKDHHR